MSKPVRRGRPPIADYCVECHREGLRPPEAGEKEWGSSYCRRHLYAQQKVSRARRMSQKAVKLGLWDEIPQEAVEHLEALFATEVAKANGNLPARTHKQARIVATSFEYSCLDLALQLSRRITEAEEDELIEAYGGSRASGTTIRWASLPGSNDITGPVKLPDDNLRTRMRAEGKGGPTTEGEPLYQDYYKLHYGYEPSEVEREPESPDDMVRVKDPQHGYMNIKRSMMSVYEADLERRLAGEEGTLQIGDDRSRESTQAGDNKAPVEDLTEGSPRFVLPDSDAIKSFSQLQAENEKGD